MCVCVCVCVCVGFVFFLHCLIKQISLYLHFDRHMLYAVWALNFIFCFILFFYFFFFYSAMKKILKKRTLVLSRSTYAGSGHHTSHWLGDNHSTWEDLYRSIAGIIC